MSTRKVIVPDEFPLSVEDVVAELRRKGLTSLTSATLASFRAGPPDGRRPVANVAASPEVSDRASDTFDNASKTASREGNLLAVVEQADELWEDETHTRLRCVWAELAGKTGHRTLEMLEHAGVVAPRGFVGIDLDAATIVTHAAQFPDYTWITGDILDLLQAPELETVGILNVDAYDMVGAPGVGARARLIADLGRRAVDRLGAFVAFWNADADAPRRLGIKPSVALRRHVTMLAEALGGLGRRRMRLGPDDFVPPGHEVRLDDPAFVGLVGRFEVYRGRAGGHRMANLRLVLR